MGKIVDSSAFREKCLTIDTASALLESIADRRGRADSETPVAFTGYLYPDSARMIAASGIVLDAVSGANWDRIGRCKICNQIFWAQRDQSPCCSETCRKNWNQQKSRENRGYKLRGGKVR
jgi:hypothetical protein